MDIRHGLSTVLFDASGEINKNIVLEEGCWYLCSDTVELFVCVNSYDGLTLKKVNEVPDNLLTRDDLADFVYKTDLEGLASKTYVDEKFESIIVPEVDLSNYYNKTETENAINEAINHIEIPEVNLEDYAKKSDIPTDYLKEVPAEYITEDELNAKSYLTQHQDISHLATKAELPDISKFITSIPQEYITENELDAKGYLTSHQSLENYATKAFVEDVIADIDIPEVDTENFVTTEGLVSALGSKANEIPFTADTIVKASIGGFAEGENTNINGWSVTEILAKLLGLDGSIVDPDEPEIPEGQEGIIANLIVNSASMYAVNANAEFVKLPFNYKLMTQEEAAAIGTTSGFYQIKDVNGDIIESGYQELQANSDDVYYVIALPKEIDYESMVTLKVWDENMSEWTATDKFEMTTDPEAVAELCAEVGIDISAINQEVYTIYVWEDLPSGSILRYIINE
jgi:hypothetical protein